METIRTHSHPSPPPPPISVIVSHAQSILPFPVISISLSYYPFIQLRHPLYSNFELCPVDSFPTEDPRIETFLELSVSLVHATNKLNKSTFINICVYLL